MADIKKTAERAYHMAQRRETAIIQTAHGPRATGTNTRDFSRANPRRLLGIYNAGVSFQWILEDLKYQLENDTQLRR